MDEQQLWAIAQKDPEFVSDPLHTLYQPIVVRLPDILGDYFFLKADTLMLLRCRRRIIRSYIEIQLAQKLGTQKAIEEGDLAYAATRAILCMTYWSKKFGSINELAESIRQYGLKYIQNNKPESLREHNLLDWSARADAELLIGQLIHKQPTLFLTLWKPQC